jgi:hypothetical protein
MSPNLESFKILFGSINGNKKYNVGDSLITKLRESCPKLELLIIRGALVSPDIASLLPSFPNFRKMVFAVYVIEVGFIDAAFGEGFLRCRLNTVTTFFTFMKSLLHTCPPLEDLTIECSNVGNIAFVTDLLHKSSNTLGSFVQRDKHMFSTPQTSMTAGMMSALITCTKLETLKATFHWETGYEEFQKVTIFKCLKYLDFI